MELHQFSPVLSGVYSPLKGVFLNSSPTVVGAYSGNCVNNRNSPQEGVSFISPVITGVSSVEKCSSYPVFADAFCDSDSCRHEDSTEDSDSLELFSRLMCDTYVFDENTEEYLPTSYLCPWFIQTVGSHSFTYTCTTLFSKDEQCYDNIFYNSNESSDFCSIH